ncbi:MAG: hypothetical protein VX520_09270, partial [Planctomycetota bacterium]|nr:hypothetical protein [Planctomycetota bacterium]
KAVRCHAALTAKATRWARLTPIFQQMGVGIGPSLTRALPEHTAAAAERIRYHNVFFPKKRLFFPLKPIFVTETPASRPPALVKYCVNGTDRGHFLRGIGSASPAV